MTTPSARISATVGFFLALTSACCLPVWLAETFINQDGSAHVYSAYLLLHPAALTALNSPAVPNSSGHWLMALLLTLLPAFTVTKVMTTLTFAGIVAAAGWIRYRTCGADGVKTAMLLGAVVAFNWLWLVGFYNFLIGAAFVGLGVGLVTRWDREIGPRRMLVLAMLFLAAYFSHIVSFCLLGGAVFVILWAGAGERRSRTVAAILVATLPVATLAVIYKMAGTGGGGLSPVWRQLSSVWSPAAWFAQLRSADPLILISRRAFPFVDGTSPWFAVFTPVFWLAVALCLLAAASLTADRSRTDFRHRPAFLFLFAGTMLAALFAPDDFGLTNGSVLRERLFIVGILFVVPLYRSGGNLVIRRAAQTILILIVGFQIAALADYVTVSNRAGRDLAIVAKALPEAANVASIVVVAGEPRFHAIPESMMTSYLGVGSGRVVWDNYEFGHRLFPLVMKSEDDRQYAFELTQVSVVASADPNRESKLARLSAALDNSGDRFDKLVVYGNDPRVDEIVSRGFDLESERSGVRIFGRRLVTAPQ